MNEIERAIAYWEEFEREIDEMPHSDILEAQREPVKTALAILRAELSRQENAPLTWDELIAMDGKPVFIVSGRGDNELNGWFLVSAERHDVESVEFTGTIDNLVLSSITDELSPEECFYGMTCNIECGEADCARNGLHHMGWLAYRYEPKGATK